MIQDAEFVLNQARMYLNDMNIQLWDDSTLMPMLQQAHRELQVQMRQSAAPIMRGYYSEPISIEQDSFANPPNDLIQPIQLWSSPTPNFVAPNLMTEMIDLPDPSLVNNPLLSIWSFAEQLVRWVPISTTSNVLMIYQRSLPLPAAAGDSISFIEGELWLGPRTAAIAMGTVGEENTSSTAAQNATEWLSAVILANRGRAPQAQSNSNRP